MAEVASADAMRAAIMKMKNNIEFNRSRIGDLERIIMEGVTIPDVGSYEVRASQLAKDGSQPRSQQYSAQSESEKYRTKVIQLVR